MIDIFEILKENIADWDLLQSDWIGVEAIEGGLSNKIYKAFVKDHKLSLFKQLVGDRYKKNSQKKVSIKPISKVLIRIYGGSHKDAEQTAKERLEEKNRFALIASQGLGPDFYFDFGDGRLEEFVDGRIAKMEEMADLKFCQEIARQIARFHLIKGVTRQSTSSFQKHVKGFLWVIRRRSCGDLKSLDIDSEGSFSSAKNVYKMMGNSGSVKSIRESIQQDIDYYRQRKTSISSVKLENFMTLSELHREYQWLCKQLENCGNLAFCHNDVQRGNIMVEKPSRRVRLIDFEYSEWNFRAFEFGNFFCECYIDNFWDDGNTFSLRRELFPRRERMIRVLKTYLEEMAKLKKEQSVLNEAISKEADARRRKSVSCNGKLAEENGAHPSSDKSVSSTKVEETESEFQRGGASTNGDKSFDEPLCVDREVETFYEETKIGMLCSHFYWALWGLIQEAVADIDWEYREYAAARMAEYTELKAKLVEGKWE